MSCPSPANSCSCSNPHNEELVPNPSLSGSGCLFILFYHTFACTGLMAHRAQPQAANSRCCGDWLTGAETKTGAVGTGTLAPTVVPPALGSNCRHTRSRQRKNSGSIVPPFGPKTVCFFSP